ncbi:MAG: glycosyltransferase [Alphaproteobacteria bacterium]|nr:glycosyltransferase [Alphaproteobacteria bacterium]
MMMFTFWAGPVPTELDSVNVWRKSFPNFHVFGDTDVIPLLDNDRHRDIYKRITLPACKSDIARLILLREYGGLYVDAHTGPSDAHSLAETLLELCTFDLVLFGAGWDSGFNFTNAILVARRNAPILSILLDKAFSNLINHEKLEFETEEHVPYHLLNLTGTSVMVQNIFDLNAENAWQLDWNKKAEFETKIKLRRMPNHSSFGFDLYKFYNYNKEGEHWSKRQERERLFEKRRLDF